MTPIDLNLPPGSTTNGELLSDYSQCVGRLSQDVLQIDLPTGQTIDVGWLPAFDPKGSFQIVVFEGDWDNQLEPPVLVKTPDDVAVRIAAVIARLTAARGVKLSQRMPT
jgi:hypothetical protein